MSEASAEDDPGAALDGVIPTADPALDASKPEGSDLAPGEITLVGTAHVSAESVDRVREAIDRINPDVVAVELDEGRYRQFKGDAPEDLDPADLLSGSTAFQFLAYWLLSYIQTRLGERFDITPGADMIAAMESAAERDIDVALVDRDIQITVQRFWSRMRLREKLALIWQLAVAMVGVGASDDLDEDFDIEELTDTDVVTALMEEFRRFSPGGAEALIDERDAYLAHNLLALRESGHTVVAVIGAGHRAGVESYLERPETLPPLESLIGRDSRRFSIGRIVGGLIGIAFLVFFVLLAMAGVDNALLFKVFLAWFLFNGILAAALALIAGAHWTSAAVGGAVAWLTSLNPLLAPGWFAGYVELRRRPVNISDISRLNDILSDEESPISDLIAQMRAVPLFRLILIVALTNVGSMVASFLFPVAVLPFFGPPFDSLGSVLDAMRLGMHNSAQEILRWARTIGDLVVTLF